MVINAGAYPQGPPGGDQGQGSSEQGALTSHIHALFSFPSSRVYTNLELVPWSLLDESYFVRLLNVSTFARTQEFWPMT